MYARWIPGHLLPGSLQRRVLLTYVHRHTGEHVPEWARTSGARPQYATDAEWLRHTHFAVTKDGRCLDARVKHCRSHDGALIADPSIIAWNTRRQYTPNGQRIAASRVAGGIVFVDVDRGIDGFIANKDAVFCEQGIMDAYDHNRYTGESYRHPELRAALESHARSI